MNESFDFMKDAQNFFKDKIHAINNAIAHEDNPTNISKLKFQLSHAESDWKKYSELRQKLFVTNQENQSRDNSGKVVQYCKNHFWLL